MEPTTQTKIEDMLSCDLESLTLDAFSLDNDSSSSCHKSTNFFPRVSI